MAENSKIDDGGHAFPTDGVLRKPGMSLRDWFAGQALVGMGQWHPNNSHMPFAASFEAARWQAKAEWAYGMADAMLAERAKIGGAK